MKPKEEHAEEKDPVHTVSKSPPAQEGKAEASGEKKKKRKRKHSSGTGPKKEKSKRKKKAEKHEEATDGAGSTDLNLDTLATTKEEKDQLVATLPQRFSLRPAPKGTVARHFSHHELPPPPPAPRRPKSPDHPPPNRDHGRGHYGQHYQRERSRSIERRPHRRRDSKGVKHRERGRYWPFRRR